MSTEAAEAYNQAQYTIKQVIANGSDSLTLSDSFLSNLPPEVADIRGIKSLDLTATNISDVSSISTLTSLEHLSLAITPVSDIKAIENLTNLKRLDLHLTQVNDLTPLSRLVNLEFLDLAYLAVGDLSPLSQLIHLRHLNMKNNGVIDFRPIRKIILPDTEPNNPEDFSGFVQCWNDYLHEFDPELSEIFRTGYQGTKAILQYLNKLDDDDYDRRIAAWHAKHLLESAPNQDNALVVVMRDGKVDVAPSLPQIHETQDQVKLKSLARLRDAVAVLLRAGNQHLDIDNLARRMHVEIEKPLPDIDLFKVHVELCLCRSIYDRRSDRKSDDILSAEVLSALEVVALVGPGLTFGNPEVDLLEDRRRQNDAVSLDPALVALQDQLSQTIASNVSTFGPNLVEYQKLFLSAPIDSNNRVRVWQRTLNRNALIFAGCTVLLALESGPLGQIGSTLTSWLLENREPILHLAKHSGSQLSDWMSLLIAHISDFKKVLDGTSYSRSKFRS